MWWRLAEEACLNAPSFALDQSGFKPAHGLPLTALDVRLSQVALRETVPDVHSDCLSNPVVVHVVLSRHQLRRRRSAVLDQRFSKGVTEFAEPAAEWSRGPRLACGNPITQAARVARRLLLLDV